jgi:hypothetical protein
MRIKFEINLEIDRKQHNQPEENEPQPDGCEAMVEHAAPHHPIGFALSDVEAKNGRR